MTKNVLKIFVCTSLILCMSCNKKATYSEVENNKEFNTALEKHLHAITNKDIEMVKATLPEPEESMILILPDGTKMDTAGEFIKMHDNWFKETESNWKLTFNTKYTHSNKNIGYAVVEALLKEPNRNGKPYEHKMYVTYVLEKINGKWLVIKDHASSISKTE